MRARIALALVLAAPACGQDSSAADAAAPAVDAAGAGWSAAPALPTPIANNAVAAVVDGEGCTLYSALGIDERRSARGIVRSAFAWRVGDAQWTPIADVPGTVGRIAASAVGLRGKLYVLGGYSVADGGAETSHDAVDVYDPAVGSWSSAAPLPIPIDDAVAVAWRDRWIVVVTGWSNTGNVDAVQIFDADTGAWSSGTVFPGTPVFGAAGALAGDELVLIDGVSSGPAGFALVGQAWRGQLDPSAPTSIEWTDLGLHLGARRYRAAGGALPDGRLLFQGGTDEPYNFDGLGYVSGKPSPPVASGLAYDAGELAVFEPSAPVATMDHRALAACPDAVFVVGGMTAGPTVASEVWRFALQ